MSIYTDTAPATLHAEITPSDTVDLIDGNGTPRFRALYVKTDGDLVLMDMALVQVTYAVVSGMVLPFRPRRVMEASTATVIGWSS